MNHNIYTNQSVMEDGQMYGVKYILYMSNICRIK